MTVGVVAHESFLVHRRYRFLKAALLLAALSIVLYVAWRPEDGHNGGTWLGYTLGTVGALLIIWLMLLGIRKRRYGPGGWSLKAWLSAHVYLGVAVVVVATLHAGFELGWNIHTLAYLLTWLTVVTGVTGLWAYVAIPHRMTVNRGGQTLTDMARAIVAVDRQCAELALPLGDAFVAEVQRSRERTRIGGGILRQLSGRARGCATSRALDRVRNLTETAPREQREAAGGLIVALGGKADLLRRARRDIRLKALLDAWLLLHVPLSFALLAALTAHVVSVFFYWA